MRSGETLRRDTVRFLLAAIQTEEKARLGAAVDKLVAEGKDETARQAWLAQNKPGNLDDVAVTDVLTKQAKMRRDSIEAFRKGERPDLVQKEEKELALISAYLPEQLDEAKIRAIATRIIGETGAKGPQDTKLVMPKVIAETKGRLRRRGDASEGARVVTAAGSQITILIPDPEEMMFVAGDDEANIDRIEREFGVKIVSRGAELRISGEAPAVARVGDLVGAMRTLSGRDQSLRKPALERLIGEAKDSPIAAPTEMREVVATTVRGKRIAPQSENQRRYIEAIRKHDLVFAIGPAGTGKSYLAVAMGVAALRDRKVSRLILTRPAVEAGERLGFLPGDLEEKIDPYLRPLYDALYELMPPERFARAQERGEIEVAPLAFMRGRTLNEAFIILDEAQNTTPQQMKMFLTRLGFGSQAVVTGDVTQIDIAGDRSGLVIAREILRDVEGLAIVDFDDRDVVRHELVARIVRAYDRFEKGNAPK